MKKHKSINLFIAHLFIFFLLNNSSLIAQDEGKTWALVMSKGAAYKSQVWRTRSYFPKKEIGEFWDKGYSITSLSYGNGLWSLVMSQGLGYSTQYWNTSAEFPQGKIEDYWEKEYNVTNLTYGDGVWALVMTKGSKYSEQIWRTRNYFPDAEIKEFWDKGYSVTSLDYGNGLWALVMSKGTGYGIQAWRTRNYFPKNEIKELWDMGYDITNLTYGEGNWALIMTKGTNFGEQVWRTRDYYPEKEIREFWDKGYFITGLYSGIYETSQVKTTKAPEVVWNKPYSNNTKVNQTEYTIRACVKTEMPLTRITVYVNNVVPILSESRGFEVVPNDGCDVAIERKIKLNKGKNELKLVVTNPGGSTTAELRTVYYEAAPQEVITSPKDKRLALIVGNGNYINAPLKNPVNDAKAMESTLKALGFEVIKVENATQSDLKKAIDDFGTKLKDYQAGLFFYAGHGIQVKGNNYLIPVNANINNEQDVEYECVDAGRVLAKMEAAGIKMNIVILDACRNNPFERSWSRSTQGNGLANMDAPLGTIVAYATSPGKTASDGSAGNGLYTEELLKQIKTPNIKIEEVFKRVREEVVRRSDNIQTPWESSSLIGDFYFSR